MASTLYILLGLLVLAFICSADELDVQEMDEYDDFIDEDILGGEHAVAIGVFPDSSVNSIIAGDVTTVIMVLTNTGNDVFNVSSIGAFISHPLNAGFIIQNFTRIAFSNVIVQPSHQVSVEYPIRVDPSLEDLDLQFVGDAKYTLVGENSLDEYSVTFFNDTVHINPSKFTFEIAALASYLLYGGAMAFVAHILSTTVFYSPKRAKIPVKKNEKKVEKPQNDLDDYLPAGLKLGSNNKKHE